MDTVDIITRSKIMSSIGQSNASMVIFYKKHYFASDLDIAFTKEFYLYHFFNNEILKGGSKKANYKYDIGNATNNTKEYYEKQ